MPTPEVIAIVRDTAADIATKCFVVLCVGVSGADSTINSIQLQAVEVNAQLIALTV